MTKLILGTIAYILIGLYVAAYTFNHIDPWAGLIIGLGLVGLYIKLVKPKLNQN